MKTITKDAALTGTALGSGRFKFLLSSPFETDAYGDVVGDENEPEYGWDLSVFRKNPVTFWAHNSSEPPIAKWENVGVRDGALRGTLIFPEKGIYPFADQIHALCDAGLIKGCSVGFKPVKSTPRADGGWHYQKMVLMEVSLCGIPAHPSALMEAKQLGIPEDVIYKVFKMDTNKKKPVELVGARIRRARRVVAKAKRMLANSTNPATRATLLRTIAILSAEDDERMKLSRQVPARSSQP